jgi:hypothetical protein
MKETARLELILVKYKLTLPVSFFVKRKIFKSKRKTLARILRIEKYNSVFVSAAVYFSNLFNRLGVSLTLAGGARAFATTAVFSVLVVIMSSMALVYNYTDISGIYIAKPEIQEHQEYQEGYILAADRGTKIIRDNNEISLIQSKDRLITKDEIITGDSGFFLFQLERKTLVRVMAKSSAAVEIESNEKEIKLHFGIVLCNVREMAEDEKFRVSTPNAVIDIVGTQFSVTYENQATKISVNKGAVLATNLVTEEKVKVKEGSTAVINNNEIKLKDSEKTESTILQKFGSLEYIENVQEKSDKEMEDLREIIQNPDNETKVAEEDKENIKIITLEDIKRKYGKLEEIQLYNGKTYTGAIISREGIFAVMTVTGIKNIPSKNVKNVRIIK